MDTERSRVITKNDLQLLARLWPLTKPFRLLLAVGILMIIASALVSLVLPYLTKVAIDSYILPIGHIFYLDNPDNIPENLRGRLDHDSFEASGQSGLIILKPVAKSLLDSRQERELTESGLMDPEPYYIKRLNTEAEHEEAVRLASSNSSLKVFPHHLLILEKELASLPDALRLTIRSADIKGLGRLAMIFGFLMIFGYIFELGQRVIMEAGAQKLGHNLRQTLLAHLFSLNQSFFDRQQAGQLTSRLTSDINNINALIKSTAASFFSDILSLVGVTVIMFMLSPKLAMTTLLLTPLACLLSWHYSRMARGQQRDLRSKLSAINQTFSETIAGLGIIQAFRRESHNSANFEALNQENYLVGLRQVHSVAIFLPLVDLCAAFVLALLIWFGGLGVIDNTVSLGVLAAFVGYANRFFIPIKDLAEKVNTFQSAFASMERLTYLLGIEEFTIPHADPPLTPVKPGGLVEFKNVSFRYGPDLPMVLNDLSFTIKAGESVALVGSTGSGKSSIINLILRFYDPIAGEITFDGQPLTNLDLSLHRHRIGLVTQDVYLYAASVMDNLRLGRTELSDETIIAAARAVGADNFINQLPNGYNELLGPEGHTLSAGQRQLIACARALIEAPEFVILDEATAFVDSESELLIEQAMQTLFSGRTSIIIAHRLSTIRRANRIMVLNWGRLVECGNHDELVAKEGLYYHLAALQGLVQNKNNF